MLELMIGAFIIALIAGALGFTGVAGAAMGVAKIIFFVLLAIGLLILALGIMGIVAVF